MQLAFDKIMTSNDEVIYWLRDIQKDAEYGIKFWITLPV